MLLLAPPFEPIVVSVLISMRFDEAIKRGCTPHLQLQRFMVMVKEELPVVTSGGQMILEVHLRPQSNVLPELVPAVKTRQERLLDLL